jgi:hypothetical protein
VGRGSCATATGKFTVYGVSFNGQLPHQPPRRNTDSVECSAQVSTATWTTPAGRLGVALHERPHLLPHEAAHTLRCSEGEVRTLLRQGRLVDCSADRLVRIDVGSLQLLVQEEVALGHLSPTAASVLADIVRGRVRVPKGERCAGNTPPRKSGLNGG